MADLATSGASSVLLLGAIAPLTEEILFRGAILKGLVNFYSPRKAVILSAIIFTLFHLNPYQFFSALTMGLFLGFLYLKTRSIIPCIIAHCIFNVHGIMLTLLFSIEISGYTLPSTFETVQFQPVWLDLSGLALLIIGSLLLSKSLTPTLIDAEQGGADNAN